MGRQQANPRTATARASNRSARRRAGDDDPYPGQLNKVPSGQNAIYLVGVTREDPESFLRAMLAPLDAARPGEPRPGVPFSHEAVANAFVMLGLLPEARAEEILASYRAGLEAKGFKF